MMGLWVMSTLLCAALTMEVEEPPPINYEETIDLVAQQEQRVKWMGCMIIIILFKDKEETQNLIREHSKFPYEASMIRLTGNLLLQCLDYMTVPLGERLLFVPSTNPPEDQEIIDKCLKVNLEDFMDERNDISLTAEQRELLARIDAVGVI